MINWECVLKILHGNLLTVPVKVIVQVDYMYCVVSVLTQYTVPSILFQFLQKWRFKRRVKTKRIKIWDSFAFIQLSYKYEKDLSVMFKLQLLSHTIIIVLFHIIYEIHLLYKNWKSANKPRVQTSATNIITLKVSIFSAFKILRVYINPNSKSSRLLILEIIIMMCISTPKFKQRQSKSKVCIYCWETYVRKIKEADVWVNIQTLNETTHNDSELHSCRSKIDFRTNRSTATGCLCNRHLVFDLTLFPRLHVCFFLWIIPCIFFLQMLSYIIIIK